MSKHSITIEINGESFTREVDSRKLLIHFLRDDLALTGTHIGCDTSSCGACTILLNGKSIKACTFFAVQANNQKIETIEGVEQGGQLHPLQEGFHQEHGLQCKLYCLRSSPVMTANTPGISIATLLSMLLILA